MENFSTVQLLTLFTINAVSLTVQYCQATRTCAKLSDVTLSWRARRDVAAIRM